LDRGAYTELGFFVREATKDEDEEAEVWLEGMADAKLTTDVAIPALKHRTPALVNSGTKSLPGRPRGSVVSVVLELGFA
jgi:hypothetical protein